MQKESRRGFTLIEVLLAAMVFSVIALSIYAVFSQGLRVERRLQDGSLVGKDFFWSVYQIAKDLENMKPYTVSEGQDVYLKGTQHDISFLTAGKKGLEEVHYEVTAPEAERVHRVEVNRESTEMPSQITASKKEAVLRKYTLIRKRHLFLKEPSSLEDEGIEVLSEKAAEDGLVFSYFGIDDEGNEVWLDEWQQQSWPIIVRVDLTVLDGQDSPVRLVRDVFPGVGMSEKDRGDEE